MFILECLVYLVFAIIMSFLAKISLCKKHTPVNLNIFIWLYVLFFAIIAGIRWNVGVDSISYALQFAKGITFNTDSELLWKWIVSLVHGWGLHWSVGLGIIAFFQILCIVKSVKQARFILVMLPFVLFGGRYWMDMMNAVRQMLVACGFLWATHLILQRNFLKYMLFIVVASQIHSSAIILIPFYFISNRYHFENYRKILIFFVVFCCIVGQNPEYQGTISSLQTLTSFVGYDGYLEKVEDLLMDYNEEKLSFGPMMLSYLLISIAIIWFGPQLRKQFIKEVPCFDIWYNLALFYSCSYFLVCNVSHIFIRPIMYFSLFQMLMASLLLFYLYTKRPKTAYVQISACLFTFIIAMNTVWDVFKASNSGDVNECSTYKAYFLHSVEQKKYNL